MKLALVSSYMVAQKVLHKITSFIKIYLIMYNCKMSVIHSFCSKGHMGSSFSLGKLLCSFLKEPAEGLFQCFLNVGHRPSKWPPLLVDLLCEGWKSRQLGGGKHCLFLKYFIYLFIGREKERGRNINVWLPLERRLLETWPTTQARALTGNWNSNPFGSQAGAQSTEPQLPGWKHCLLSGKEKYEGPRHAQLHSMLLSSQGKETGFSFA